MIVYLVTAGEYSDYTIYAAFSSEEKAWKYIQRCWNKSTFYIGHYVVDDPALEYPPGMEYWRVRLVINTGDVKNVEKLDPGLLHRLDTSYREPPHHPANMAAGPVFVTHCFARDREHAIKIASERLAREKGKAS